MNNISYVFVRHGHAAQGKEDKTRRLSQEGKDQAKRFSLYLNDNNLKFDLVITSTAMRTKETANEILKCLNQTPNVIEIEEFYEPSDINIKTHILNLIETFPSKPLKYYVSSDVGNYWNQYAEAAFNVIEKKIKEYNPRRVLLVGHGNIINSIALRINPSLKQLLEVYFEPCEGFEITSENILKMIKNYRYK